ncbi:MAG: 4Fe-4S ferredoxin [Desulfuromonas sp. SDB]|nr:MAG: 4Fe-4S ferredoxin [Desulfuromonas sp. SDB]
MAQVYFIPVEDDCTDQSVSEKAKTLLQTVEQKQHIIFPDKVPLKVHFGEKGNTTYNKPVYYQEIINYLQKKVKQLYYIETNVLYRGERTTKQKHLKLAGEHGFNQIPIIIADGDSGKDSIEVDIDKKHFKSCKLGREFQNFDHIIVLSHFKGHMLAGFGGALKNLGMGFASREGKLAQHSKAIPWLNFFQCKKCGLCADHCPADAIIIGFIPRVNSKKCIGCASCIAVCPTGAMKINWLNSLSKGFLEKLAEYAYAAQLNKKTVYLNYAINITKLCDCEGKTQKPVVSNLGLFASVDPVAIDQACLDMLDKRQGKKVFRRGRYLLHYGEEIGLGSTNYELVKLA